MTDIVTRTATRATGGARQTARGVATDTVRETARKAMSEAGSVVLGAVVDMAISRVDRVADRLDGVAESGGTGLREALTGRPAPTRSARKDPGDADKAGTAVRARMGAAFSFVVYRAVQLLRFLQRVALQLLEALRRLARRPRTAPPEPEAACADEDGPVQDAAGDKGPEEHAAGEDGEPSERRASRAERRGHRTQRSDASDRRPVRSAPTGRPR
jgi:hypothetical protein